MRIKEVVKEYWAIFLANTYDGKRKDDSLSGIQAALLLLCCSCVITAVKYAIIRDIPMLLCSLVLLVLFLGTYAANHRRGKRAVPLVLCMLGVMVVFSYYVLSGSNGGFSLLWCLLAPMLIMAAVGVKAGAVVGLYFQLLVTILFWTPLKSTMADHYSPLMMSNFPYLYLCNLVVSLAVMLNHKKQQIALDRHQEELERAVREEHNKVTQMTFQTIATISSLVDAKDTYTDDHSIRVAFYACKIAEELGWDSADIIRLHNTALLHDIGKVGIPDSILKKQGKLTGEEYEIMKTHTSIGAFILKEMRFLERADEGAQYHHERYDGRGYPFGLSGTDIPVGARIICVADAFDAMNSNRSYRKKCDDGYIMNEIREGSGTQFDPDMVMALLRCIEKGTIVFPTPPAASGM